MPLSPPTEQDVHDCVAYYRPILHLEDWDLDVQFSKDEVDGSEASCAASPEYRHAVLRFDLAIIPPAMLARTVLHEMTHCQTWRLAQVADDLCAGDAFRGAVADRAHEDVTTAFEHIIFKIVGEP